MGMLFHAGFKYLQGGDLRRSESRCIPADDSHSIPNLCGDPKLVRPLPVNISSCAICNWKDKTGRAKLAWQSKETHVLAFVIIYAKANLCDERSIARYGQEASVWQVEFPPAVPSGTDILTLVKSGSFFCSVYNVNFTRNRAGNKCRGLTLASLAG